MLGASVVLVALVCCVVVGIAVTRTSSKSSGPAIDVGRAARERIARSVAKSRAALASGLKIAPATGATAVGPDQPVVVAARTGVLSSVRVTSSDGKDVEGAFSLGADEWHSVAPLAYGTAYRVSATVATVVEGSACRRNRRRRSRRSRRRPR